MNDDLNDLIGHKKWHEWREAAAEAVGDCYLLTENNRSVARHTSDAAVKVVLEHLRNGGDRWLTVEGTDEVDRLLTQR